MASRGVFGRADLLQALALRPGLIALGLPDPADAEPLVYRLKPRSGLALPMPSEAGLTPPPARSPFRPPLRMPHGWQAERVLRAPDESRDSADTTTLAPPIAVPALVRPSEGEQQALQDRVDAPPPMHRARATLRSALCVAPTGPGRIDWPGLVRQLAQARQLRALPRVVRVAWPGHLHVVLDDRAVSVRSLAWDMAVWRSRLTRVVGESRLVVHRLGETLGALARPGAPGFDAVGHRWLVLSDGRVTEPTQRQPFADWVQGLRHRQHEVVMLAPVPTGVLAALPGGVLAVAWGSGGPVRARGGAVADGVFRLPGVADVLALLALLGQVSTLLLRGLCQCVPGAASGREWVVWNHPQVRRAGHHVELLPEHLDEHARHLRTLPVALLQRALTLQRVFQRGLPEADLHLVPMRAARLAPQLAGALAQEVDAARQFFAGLAHEGRRVQGRTRLEWSLRAARLVGKLPEPVRQAEWATFRPLAGQGWRDGGGERGEEAPRWVRRERPHWAESFVQGPEGLTAVIRWPDGTPLALELDGIKQEYPARVVRPFVLNRDQHGPKLSWPLEQGGRIKAFLDFRYIPPCTFLMGSPESAGHGDEYPQHPVTLTEGFWLADAPCTQAVWQAVMGDNPSHFSKGLEAPRRPVENVSWDDVAQFLRRLAAVLPPGCEAVLPTEAQWEYAARAGTSTAYWWGDEPDGSKANFDLDNTKDWDDQEGTSPVDRYPPNPWGLRDMHGNVWEWCADDRRSYENRAERDPTGSTEGDACVVRGGSWIDHPSLARSAYRFRGHRGLSDRLQGFRLCLRSSSPAPGGHKQ